MDNDLNKFEICGLIRVKYPTIYEDVEVLPKPFIGSSKIKAIVLGCDPSNLSNNRFDFVFGLENSNSPYFKSILKNLNVLGLNLENVYVQNVIQNYFNVETSKNKHWNECALLWLDYLKRELDEKFDKDIPVFVTSWAILNVLVYKKILKDYSPSLIYCNAKTFNKNETNLNRKVIGFFRHPRYRLIDEKWNRYVSFISQSF